MSICYTGDTDQWDAIPNNMSMDTWHDFEVLTISEAREDLVVIIPGAAALFLKAQWENGDPNALGTPAEPIAVGATADVVGFGNIKTQSNGQKMLEAIDGAILRKDAIRADLGAIQNRLENTISHLQIQSENLLAAESQISDVNLAVEMTKFIQSQVLGQSAVAMLAQANHLPRMALELIQRN